MAGVEGDMRFCKECGRVTLTRDDAVQGSSVCTECGLVADGPYVDTTRDVRIFEDNVGAQRVEEGDPLGKGLAATCIAGNGLSASTLRRFQKAELRKDDALKFDRSQIRAMAANLNIPDFIAERAEYIYMELRECEDVSLKGKNTRAILVGCLYTAARQLDQPKNLNDLSLGTDLTKKEISRAGKFIQLHTKDPRIVVAVSNPVPRPTSSITNSSSHSLPAADPLPRGGGLVKGQVVRLCNLLKFTFPQRRRAEEMAIAVQQLDIRRTPVSQASAIVWITTLLCNPERASDSEFKRDLLKFAPTTLATLRKTYQDFYHKLSMVLSTDIFGERATWEPKLRRP